MDYTTRIKELVDPVWKIKVSKYIKTLKRMKEKLPKCSSVITLDIYKDGAVKNLTLVKSCEPNPMFNELVLDSFKSISPTLPPPENLLIDGKLTMEWEFELK